jgi:spermidine synthase
MDEILATGRTRYQEYTFWRSATHGIAIALDGDLQSSSTDRATYHEALVHPAMLLHPEPRRVLIAGGGEGATAREVLRHESVERVVMVDLDGEFVELCRRFVPEWAGGAFEDSRLEVLHEDIVAWFEGSDERFDVVLGDLVEPPEESPLGEALYGRGFYCRVADHLCPGGLVATQASCLYAADWRRHLQVRRGLGAVWQPVTTWLVNIPTFFEPWAFAAAGQPFPELPALSELFSERLASRRIELDCFDGPSLAACFALPPAVRRLLRDA